MLATGVHIIALLVGLFAARGPMEPVPYTYHHVPLRVDAVGQKKQCPASGEGVRGGSGEQGSAQAR